MNKRILRNSASIAAALALVVGAYNFGKVSGQKTSSDAENTTNFNAAMQAVTNTENGLNKYIFSNGDEPTTLYKIKNTRHDQFTAVQIGNAPAKSVTLNIVPCVTNVDKTCGSLSKKISEIEHAVTLFREELNEAYMNGTKITAVSAQETQMGLSIERESPKTDHWPVHPSGKRNAVKEKVKGKYGLADNNYVKTYIP